NRSLLVKGVFLLLASALCYAVAWLFFRYGVSLVFDGFRLAPAGIHPIAITALALISWSGYRHWKRGDGFKTYIETALYHDLGDESAGAVIVDHYARRITGPAYVLSQVFLGGPLLFLRGLKHIQQRLPDHCKITSSRRF
ncbi:MAG: hypothetical protein H7Z17_05115, partial [Fuerstia sp.]|nr:hypothetical protein [Fuerstiella sp.]